MRRNSITRHKNTKVFKIGLMRGHNSTPTLNFQVMETILLSVAIRKANTFPICSRKKKIILSLLIIVLTIFSIFSCKSKEIPEIAIHIFYMQYGYEHDRNLKKEFNNKNEET